MGSCGAVSAAFDSNTIVALLACYGCACNCGAFFYVYVCQRNILAILIFYCAVDPAVAVCVFAVDKIIKVIIYSIIAFYLKLINPLAW